VDENYPAVPEQKPDVFEQANFAAFTEAERTVIVTAVTHLAAVAEDEFYLHFAVAFDEVIHG
jgi:hypothetical protein